MSVYQDPIQKANSRELTSNLAWRFLDSCRAHAARTALTDSRSSYNYSWLADQCLKMANSIRQNRDFEIGCRIGLHFKNSTQYIVAFYGTLLAGGVVVPIPANCNQTRLQELRNLADIRFVIDSSFGEPEDSESPLQELEFADSNSLAMLMFTSGSTGLPKAVMLSHQNLTANADSILEFLPIDHTDRTLAISPFSHALGNSVLQTHLLRGAELVVETSVGYPQEIVAALECYQCTSLLGVPALFQGLSKCFIDRDINHLKYLAVAGGRMDPQQALELRDRIQPANLFLMYGQTEATARLSCLLPEDLSENSQSIGQAIPGVQLKIVDDSGAEVETGEIGMLMANGQNIMLGYFNDSEASSTVLNEGWLTTGDLARTNAQGQIEICGRKNGLVKILGYRFHPNEIENCVQSKLPDTQVVATPFDFYGNTRVALFARPIAGTQVSESELKSICREFLPTHMVPQRFKIVDRWPLNSAGKVNRKELATIFDCHNQTPKQVNQNA